MTRLVLTSALGALAIGATSSHAADHFEAPLAAADNEADLGDLYAWVDDDGHTVLVLTWGWRTLATVSWDDRVLYGIHIDNDADQVPDHDVWMRFGKDDNGIFGVQVAGLPGADPVVIGPVLSTLDAGHGLKVWTGLAEDPFFFDLQGFEDTLATGTLSFDATRDALAGTFVIGAVFTMDTEAALDGGTQLDIWATSSRLGGAR